MGEMQACAAESVGEPAPDKHEGKRGIAKATQPDRAFGRDLLPSWINWNLCLPGDFT
jgi:hypothetical protein